MTRVPAPLLVIAAAFSLQFGAAIARLFFDEVGPLGASLLRLAFATVILLAVMRPRVRTWTRSTWAATVLLGVALGGMNAFIYLAFERIPLGVAVTIEFLGPLALALAQTRRWVDAAWAALALGGVVLLGVRAMGGELDPVGLLLAVAAGACWAGYIVAGARVGREGADPRGLAVAMAVGTVLVLPLGAGDAVGAVGVDPGLLLVFAGVAVLSSALPYALDLWALRRMPTRVFGVLSALGPAAGAIAGAVVLHERLGWPELAALAAVTAASIGVTLHRPPRAPEPV